MHDTDTLTETEKLLLMAAAVHDLGSNTNLMCANTSRIVNQVLLWRGLSVEEIRRGWRTYDCDAAHEEVYNALVRMTHQQCRDGSFRPGERQGATLFEGGGNWGVPGDASRPACWPQYNSCRLTDEGERLAQSLLQQYPEFRKSAEQ